MTKGKTDYCNVGGIRMAAFQKESEISQVLEYFMAFLCGCRKYEIINVRILMIMEIVLPKFWLDERRNKLLA